MMRKRGAWPTLVLLLVIITLLLALADIGVDASGSLLYFLVFVSSYFFFF